MMIEAECPFCEERFQLQPDMLGKTTRCPACKRAFVVSSTSHTAPPPLPKSVDLPYERIESESMSIPRAELLPEVEVALPAEVVVPKKPKPPTGKLLPPAPVTKPKPKSPSIDDAPSVFELTPKKQASGLRPPSIDDAPSVFELTPKMQRTGPREMTWSDGIAPPLPRGDDGNAPLKPKKKLVEEPVQPDKREDDVDEELAALRRKRRGRTKGKWIALGLLGAILFTGLATVFGLWRYNVLAEERLHEAAKFDYSESNFAGAKEKYEQLVADYPESSDIDQYRFFARLTAMQIIVRAPSAVDDPTKAREAYDAFTKDFAESPWAAAETGYGAEIVQSGKQLADVLADHGTKRLNNFQADRKKMEELAAVGTVVQQGRDLLPVVEKFREKNGVPLDTQRARFEELNKLIERENLRLQVLLPFRNLSVDPTASKIEEFEKALKANDLSTDAEARAMLADAERKLREMPGYSPRRIPAAAIPVDPSAPVVLTAPLGVEPKPPTMASDDLPVFAVARGILYALDPVTGRERWGARIASPTADTKLVDLPTPAMIGEDDWVFVVGETAGQPGITARRARTGEVLWYQPLEAPPAGRAHLIGSRVYVPLADAYGTVVECEATSGVRLGDLSIRQPIGAPLSSLPTGRPGGDLLIVPGDAKRIFIYELGREDADGNRIAPRRVRVMITEHPRGSLRGEAVVIQPSDEDGPRYLILTQTEGPTTMKLRSFPLPKPEAIIAAGDTVPVESRDAGTETPVAGWSWFPALSNGERFVVASDAGAFFAFGVNQLGNQDAPLFPLPAPKATKEQDGVSRSLIVTADEDAYWVVIGGQLLRYRTAVSPAEGLRVIADGQARRVGEPIHRGQVRPAVNAGYITTRDQAGSIQSVCFDLNTGELRWTRRLGIVPAGPAVALGNDRVLVVDEDGGAYRVPISGGVELVAPPIVGGTGKATIASSADGKIAWLTIPEIDKAGRRLRLRSLEQGMLKVDTVVPLPDLVAGPAVVVGDAVVIPLMNGYLYRFRAGDVQLNVGPLWRGDGGAGELICFMTPLANDELLVSDGSRKFIRWKWPIANDAKATKVAGPWELPGKLAVPPVLLNVDGQEQVAAIDSQGVLYFFDASRVGESVRRKRPSAGGIPAGRPTRRLMIANPEWIVYTVADRHIVCVNVKPNVADVVFENVVPLGAADLLDVQGMLVTDPAGAVRQLNLTTKKLSDWSPPLPGLPPLVVGAVPISDAFAFAVGLDGCGRWIATLKDDDIGKE